MSITVLEIRKKLKEIDWNINVDYLKDDAPLIEQGFDSLDLIELLLCLEIGFSVKIPDKDLNELKTLNDFVIYINKRLQ